jgi:putative SbcD/Mre11-related phosphoesterase
LQYEAVLRLRRGRALLIADTHIGLELELKRERGVNVASQTERIARRVVELADSLNATLVVILGDVKHELRSPRDSASEVRAFLSAVARRVPVLLTPGNHDTLLREIAEGIEGVVTAPARGILLDDKYLLLHGHAKPRREDLERAGVVIMGHTHPAVMIRDDIGYYVKVPALLKIHAQRRALCESLYGEPCEDGGVKIVVLPALHPLLAGVDVRELPRASLEGKSILKYVEWRRELAEVYLPDMTFLGTLADLQEW